MESAPDTDLSGGKFSLIISIYFFITISPFLLVRFFNYSYDDSMEIMVVFHVIFSLFLLFYFSDKIPDLNFNFCVFRKNVKILIIFLIFCILQSFLYSYGYSSGGASYGFIFVVVVVLLAPFYEEVFFRGVVFGFFSIRFKEVVGLRFLVTNLFFCFVHFNDYNLFDMSNVFISGVLLYYLRKLTTGILYSFLLHCGMNFMSLYIR